MEYASVVETALEKTGYEMYANIPVINVPSSVFLIAYKASLLVLVEEEGGMGQMHECLEDVILSIMLGMKYLHDLISFINIL